MAAVGVTISGFLVDKYGRTMRPVTLVGEASLTGLSVGGGPMPGGPGNVEPPLGIWGGANEPFPGGGPIIPPEPTEPPTGQPDEDGFLKAPPAEGGWAFHEDYQWLYKPGPGQAGPKKA